MANTQPYTLYNSDFHGGALICEDLTLVEAMIEQVDHKMDDCECGDCTVICDEWGNQVDLMQLSYDNPVEWDAACSTAGYGS